MMCRGLTCCLLAGCFVVLLVETPSAVRELRLGFAGPYGDEATEASTVAAPAARETLAPTVAQEASEFEFELEFQSYPMLASIPEAD
ncbi:MAG TPA: hypothetical protein ENJ09_06625 [Planctomycetes bacterium]|nr:hypothetical protein [Planctomycetota bacterium]